MKAEHRDLLHRAAGGDGRAADELIPTIYDELRELAAGYLRDAPGAVMLQPTMLVHEVYLKLAEVADLDEGSRTWFRALSARAMRQVLVDHLRNGQRQKRGGGWQRVTLSGVGEDFDRNGIDVELLNDAIKSLAAVDERAATGVVLRYFGGLGDEAIGQVLDVTDRTVRNDRRMAQAWLRRALRDAEEKPGDP